MCSPLRGQAEGGIACISDHPQHGAWWRSRSLAVSLRAPACCVRNRLLLLACFLREPHLACATDLRRFFNRWLAGAAPVPPTGAPFLDRHGRPENTILCWSPASNTDPFGRRPSAAPLYWQALRQHSLAAPPPGAAHAVVSVRASDSAPRRRLMRRCDLYSSVMAAARQQRGQKSAEGTRRKADAGSGQRRHTPRARRSFAIFRTVPTRSRRPSGVAGLENH